MSERTHEDRLLEPLKWRKPCRVFVNSMSDLFHEDVPDDFIDRVFAVMALARQHTFQILTKRPFRMAQYVTPARRQNVEAAGELIRPSRPPRHWYYASDWSARLVRWPLPNVWLGVSVENQKYADERIPLLLQAPAAVRFISAEPLLGPIDLTRISMSAEYKGITDDALRGHHNAEWGPQTPTRSKLDWIIVGGESGAGARPCDVAWIRSIVEQCRAAAVPVFVKQFGAKPEIEQGCGDCDPCIAGQRCCLGYPVGLRLKDRKGGAPSEWPYDLRVRQFPTESKQ